MGRNTYSYDGLDWIGFRQMDRWTSLICCTSLSSSLSVRTVLSNTRRRRDATKQFRRVGVGDVYWAFIFTMTSRCRHGVNNCDWLESWRLGRGCRRVTSQDETVGVGTSRYHQNINKKLSYCWETVRRESMPRIAEMDVEMKT